MNRIERIKKILFADFEPSRLDLKDHSFKHSGHNNFDGTGMTHLYLQIKSDKFTTSHIIMPMAGCGSRFKGISDIPKPFIPIMGSPMYKRALGSLPTSCCSTNLVCKEEHREMIKNLKRGDEVITSGGIIGTIDRVFEDDRVELKIAEDVKVQVIKNTVQSHLKKEVKK
mgnify:CR=1 FL=1